MKFIFGIIGGYIGALIDSFSGFFFGAAIGFLFGYIIELKKVLHILEDKVSAIQSKLIDSNVMADQTTSDGIQVDNNDIEEISIAKEAVDPEEVTQINSAYKVTEEKPEPEITHELTSWKSISADGPGTQNLFEKIISYIRGFFTTGNVVVKVDVIILFFGVAFLLKYAAQRNAFPIELRFNE